MLEELGEVPKRRNSEGKMKVTRATCRGQIFVIMGESVQALWEHLSVGKVRGPWEVFGNILKTIFLDSMIAF